MIENIQPILVQKGKFPLITSNDIKIYVVPFCYIPTRTNLVQRTESHIDLAVTVPLFLLLDFSMDVGFWLT